MFRWLDSFEKLVRWGRCEERLVRLGGGRGEDGGLELKIARGKSALVLKLLPTATNPSDGASRWWCRWQRCPRRGKGAAQCRRRRPKSLSAAAAYCRVKITNALPLLCVTEEKTKNAVPILKWGSLFQNGQGFMKITKRGVPVCKRGSLQNGD